MSIVPSLLLLDLGEILLKLDFSHMVRGLGFGETATLDEAMRVLNGWELYDRFERGHVSEGDFHRALTARLGREIPHPEFLKIWNSVIVGPVPGAEELVDSLSEKIPMYALTNTNESHMRHVTGKYPFLKKFRHIFTSHELGARKPEARVYQAVARHLSVEPAKILFIDDRRENVEGAKRVGLMAEL
jgi:putative hydrolase of the HAD superfamily